MASRSSTLSVDDDCGAFRMLGDRYDVATEGICCSWITPDVMLVLVEAALEMLGRAMSVPSDDDTPARKLKREITEAKIIATYYRIAEILPGFCWSSFLMAEGTARLSPAFFFGLD